LQIAKSHLSQKFLKILSSLHFHCYYYFFSYISKS